LGQGFINESLTAEYTAKHFHGLFWWSDGIGFWCIEIWQNGKYNSTYIGAHLTDLIGKVQSKYGLE